MEESCRRNFGEPNIIQRGYLEKIVGSEKPVVGTSTTPTSQRVYLKKVPEIEELSMEL